MVSLITLLVLIQCLIKVSKFILCIWWLRLLRLFQSRAMVLKGGPQTSSITSLGSLGGQSSYLCWKRPSRWFWRSWRTIDLQHTSHLSCFSWHFIFIKSPGQFHFRMSHILNFSEHSLMVWFKFNILAGIGDIGHIYYIMLWGTWYLMILLPFLSDTKIEHLANVVTTRWIPSKGYVPLYN